MPQTIACVAPVQLEAVRAGSGEDALLDHGLLVQADLGHARAEPFRVLLADERGDVEDACGLEQLCGCLGDACEGGIGTEALLHIDHDERGVFAREQAHRAAAIVSERSR